MSNCQKHMYISQQLVLPFSCSLTSCCRTASSGSYGMHCLYMMVLISSGLSGSVMMCSGYPNTPIVTYGGKQSTGEYKPSSSPSTSLSFTSILESDGARQSTTLPSKLEPSRTAILEEKQRQDISVAVFSLTNASK